MNKGKKFNHDVEKFVKTLNPKDGVLSYKWRIQTKYEPLDVTVHRAELRQKFFAIFTRFDDPRKAKDGVPESNPFSGKWNFRSSDSEYTLQKFKNEVNEIIIMEE